MLRQIVVSTWHQTDVNKSANPVLNQIQDFQYDDFKN